jgi:uncharacterized membrane protein YhaH (DUF805 family)
MTPIDWAVGPLKRNADFSGRAPRAEYWWYVLAVGTVGFFWDSLMCFFCRVRSMAI